MPVPYTEALERALGEILAEATRDIAKELEHGRAQVSAMRAEHEARLAEVEARFAAREAERDAEHRAVLELLKAKIADREAEHKAAVAELRGRLAEVRDGVDGKDGVDGRDGQDGKDAPDLTPVLVEWMDAQQAEIAVRLDALRDGADGKDGRDGVDGKDAPDPMPMLVDWMESRAAEIAESLAKVRDGKDGKDGRDGKDGKDGQDGRDGVDGKDGALPAVRDWVDDVHSAGMVVTHNGALWQARKDTGKEPPHEDWHCLARAGRDGQDGRTMRVCGTFKAEADYEYLDVVAHGGASWVAVKDNPGDLPGDGWQLLSSVGKRGPKGEDGQAGPRGLPGPAPLAAEVDADSGMVILTNADGSTVKIDLYPLFAKVSK